MTRPALRVLVASLVIEDGAVPPPRVGGTASFWLVFGEAAADDAVAGPVEARVESRADGRPDDPGMRWDGVPHTGPPFWTTRLHGVGWAATWAAPRLVTGDIALYGRLVADAWCPPVGATGLVERVRVVTETRRKIGTDRWERLDQQLRDVDVAPAGFDHGLVRAPGSPPTGWAAAVPGDPWVDEVGVLVDLAAAPLVRG